MKVEQTYKNNVKKTLHAEGICKSTRCVSAKYQKVQICDEMKNLEITTSPSASSKFRL